MSVNKFDIEKNGIKNIIVNTICVKYGVYIGFDYDDFIITGCNDLNIGVNYSLDELNALFEVVECHFNKIEESEAQLY